MNTTFDPADFAKPGRYDMGMGFTLHVQPSGNLLLVCGWCMKPLTVSELTQDALMAVARSHRPCDR